MFIEKLHTKTVHSKKFPEKTKGPNQQTFPEIKVFESHLIGIKNSLVALVSAEEPKNKIQPKLYDKQ